MNALLRFMTEQLWAMEPGVLQAAAVVLERHLAGVDLTKDQIEAIKIDRDRRRSPRMAFLAAAEPMRGPKESTCQAYRVGTVAVVPIEGMLANHASLVNDISQPDGMTHADIEAQIQAAADNPQVKSILLAISSPGGTVRGTTGLAAVIRAAKAVKPVVALCLGTMASAAYWVGCQADEVYCDSPTDSVGSIGCYVVATDTSAQMAAQGVRKVLIKAGEFKAGVVPGLPITDTAVSEVEAQLAEVQRVFTSDVASARGMSPQKATSVANGRVFIGQQAVDVGLADGIKSAADVIAHMEQQFGSSTTKRGFSATAHERALAMSNEPTPTAKKTDKSTDPTNGAAPGAAPAVAAAPTIETKPETVATAPAVAKGTPATFDELNAAFGGKTGGAELIVKAQAGKMTLMDAYAAYTTGLEAQLAAKPAETKPATHTAPAALNPVATFTPGVQANTGAPGAPTDFAAAVTKVMAEATDLKDKPKDQALAIATARATKQFPELHAAWRAADFAPLKIAQ